MTVIAKHAIKIPAARSCRYRRCKAGVGADAQTSGFFDQTVRCECADNFFVVGTNPNAESIGTGSRTLRSRP